MKCGEREYSYHPSPLLLIKYCGFHGVERRRGVACHPLSLILNISLYNIKTNNSSLSLRGEIELWGSPILTFS